MKHKKSKAIFWDRDGVLNNVEVKNGKSYSPRKFANFQMFPYVKELIKECKHMDYLNIIFTNQPDISRSLMKQSELDLMNDFLLKNLLIDEIIYCPHSEEDHCLCRKPKPGMINYAFKKYNLDLRKSIVIGDRITDIISGYRAGVENLFLLKKDYSYNCYNDLDLPSYQIINDIRDLPKLILQKNNDKNIR